MKVILFLLTVSTCLFVGCASLFAPATIKYIRYPISEGDTLYTIAERFDVDWQSIKNINNIADERALKIGQLLNIPYHGQNLSREPVDSGGRASLALKPGSSTGSGKKVPLAGAAYLVGKLSWPVTNGELGSSFGRRWFSFHEGVDIRAPEGTAVLAAHDGVVAYSGDGISGYGNLIVLKTKGLITVYGHNSKNLVRVGRTVRRGERIAEVGKTGKATGPHLHFETRIKDGDGKNVAVDPLSFFP